MARELIDPEKMHAPFEVPRKHGRLYRLALEKLNASGVPYVVSGAFAMYAYTGLWRNTKDLDVFVEPRDVGGVLHTLERAGFDVELTDDRWLGKAKKGDVFIDIIFAAGNMVAAVDATWMDRSLPAHVLGVGTR